MLTKNKINNGRKIRIWGLNQKVQNISMNLTKSTEQNELRDCTDYGSRKRVITVMIQMKTLKTTAVSP